MTNDFNAVYYSQPVPASMASLTLLSLVFDKLFFPGVFIPEKGIDEKETQKEINRIKALGDKSIEASQLIGCMTFALHNKYLKDFCIFTGQYGQIGILENGAKELTLELEKQIFGPPPPNFHPSPNLGFSKGLPGDKESSINGPSWISYPANSLIFSIKNALPLINDNPNLPIPALGQASPKNNAKLLSMILAIESVRIALPNLKPMLPRQIMEFRKQTKDYVKPFRLAMIKLSRDLNSAIDSEMTAEEIQAEAKFLVETTIYPRLDELKKFLHDPAKPWYKIAIDFSKNLPELVSGFTFLPQELVVAQILTKLAEALGQIRDAQRTKNQKLNRSGLYYLLKINKKINNNITQRGITS
ncbi:hypothetical protein KJ969_03685 [Patescibacteria group bacterium]|nr:hypothetical protein [Patescibacteria group bacterium]MBU1922221.1 hypothetical protein [Patescibacteria group bacterium]